LFATDAFVFKKFGSVEINCRGARRKCVVSDRQRPNPNTWTNKQEKQIWAMFIYPFMKVYNYTSMALLDKILWKFSYLVLGRIL